MAVLREERFPLNSVQAVSSVEGNVPVWKSDRAVKSRRALEEQSPISLYSATVIESGANWACMWFWESGDSDPVRGNVPAFSLWLPLAFLSLLLSWIWVLGTSLVFQWLKTSPSYAGCACLVPGQRAKIPHASWPKKNQTVKQNQCCNKFNKDFLNGPYF